MNISMLKTPRNLVIISITAALYVVLTTALGSFGYGPIQCRPSEILCLLAFIDPIYGIGVTIGCFISNLASPFGALDIFGGTFATFLAVVCISKTKNKFIATLWPTVFCAIVAGIVSYSTQMPYLPVAFSIMASEFVVVTIIGYPVLSYVCKNEKLYNLFKVRFLLSH